MGKEGLFPWLSQGCEVKVAVGRRPGFYYIERVARHLPSSPTPQQATWAAPGADMQGWPGLGLVTVFSSAWPRPGWGSERSWSSGSCPCSVGCRAAEVGMPGAGAVGSCLYWLSCC